MAGSSPQDVRSELERVLSSREFATCDNLRRFLTFGVEETLANRGDGLKEYVIATGALGRPESFDPRLDAIVRVEAGKLRRKLSAYYANGGNANTIRIELPKGSYVPAF